MFNKLQYISQGATADDQLYNVTQALDAGCKWVQLRFKNAKENDFLKVAIEVKALCAAANATFIINDHPHIAKTIDADGVHLGLDDLSVVQAREIIGNKIIGGTANTLEHVMQRVGEGCDYIGLGPFRFTTTKEKLSPVLGVEGYRKIMEALTAKQISIPVYAIGGILPEDLAALMQTGIYGVAVSGIITNHSDKKLLLDQFNTILYGPVMHS